MKDITVEKILEITGGYLQGELTPDKKEELLKINVNSIYTDSREVKKDGLFVCIIGETRDAHEFIPQVAQTLSAFLVEEDEDKILSLTGTESLPENAAYIRVDSTEAALQKIGAYVRSIYMHPVVGVTGSVGKTTTREMIATALASNIPTFSTKGNKNSQIGVPITLSEMMDEDTQAAVIEMGISEFGGMDKLTAMVKPDIAVVTIIGVSHIEFMGSQEGIRQEKLRIIGRMDENGVVFLNGDDPLLWEMKDKLPVKTYFYGLNPEADFRAENIIFHNDHTDFDFVAGETKVPVKLAMAGKHNVLNCVAAMAVSFYMGLDLEKAAESFETFKGLRQKIIKSEKGFTIIDDSYNASPDSMKAALDVLNKRQCAGRKIAVLGDMFELGENTSDYHKVVGSYINELSLKEGSKCIDELITIGNESKNISDMVDTEGIAVNHFNDKDDAVKYIKEILKEGDVITFKASNGMRFFDLVELIK